MPVRPVTIALAALALPTALLAEANDTPARGSLAVVACGHAIDTAAGRLLGETSVVVQDGRTREVRARQVDIPAYDAPAKAAGHYLPQLGRGL